MLSPFTVKAPHRFEQIEADHNVGLDKVFGAVNRAVHQAFGSEVQHSTGEVLSKQGVQQHTAAHIALHKHMARIALKSGQVIQVASLDELVDIDDELVAPSQLVDYEVATDPTGAAGDENIFFFAQCLFPVFSIAFSL